MGGAPQYKLAAEWHLKTADKGLSAAQINLGELYKRGLGVEASKEKAAYWYRKSTMDFPEKMGAWESDFTPHSGVQRRKPEPCGSIRHPETPRQVQCKELHPRS